MSQSKPGAPSFDWRALILDLLLSAAFVGMIAFAFYLAEVQS